MLRQDILCHTFNHFFTLSKTLEIAERQNPWDRVPSPNYVGVGVASGPVGPTPSRFDCMSAWASGFGSASVTTKKACKILCAIEITSQDAVKLSHELCFTRWGEFWGTMSCSSTTCIVRFKYCMKWWFRTGKDFPGCDLPHWCFRSLSFCFCQSTASSPAYASSNI